MGFYMFQITSICPVSCKFNPLKLKVPLIGYTHFLERISTNILNKICVSFVKHKNYDVTAE